MKDVKFEIENGNQFVCRAIGIAKRGNSILLQGRKGKNTWGFPGGSIACFEDSEETILREFEEEIGEKVTIKRLFAVVEDFFNYLDKYNVHQISFYYLIDINESSNLLKFEEFDGIEKGKDLIFKWIDLDSDLIIKPKEIFNELKNENKEIKHIILKEI